MALDEVEISARGLGNGRFGSVGRGLRWVIRLKEFEGL